MKLSLQQHAELTEMTQHFHQIEEIAEQMGVEVDTLVEEFKENSNSVYVNLKKNILAIAAKRQQIFRQETKSAKSNFTVIVNEERFRN